MTDQVERPPPQEAAAALDSLGNMTEVALERGLHPRWFALSVSLWVGAATVAKAYDGPQPTSLLRLPLSGAFWDLCCGAAESSRG